MLKKKKTLDEVLKSIQGCDFTLVEGYKWENLDRIEVFRTGYSTKIISKKEKLIALVTDVNKDIEVSQFKPNEYEKIAEKIKKYFEI